MSWNIALVIVDLIAADERADVIVRLVGDRRKIPGVHGFEDANIPRRRQVAIMSVQENDVLTVAALDGALGSAATFECVRDTWHALCRRMSPNRLRLYLAVGVGGTYGLGIGSNGRSNSLLLSGDVDDVCEGNVALLGGEIDSEDPEGSVLAAIRKRLPLGRIRGAKFEIWR